MKLYIQNYAKLLYMQAAPTCIQFEINNILYNIKKN
jgi:hypothetical protein